MIFIKKILVYLLLLVFDVKTFINDTENLNECLKRIDASLTQSRDSHRNLLKLIDKNTVILKAFGSENLIKFEDEQNVNDIDDDMEITSDGILNEDDYNDYYFYKNDDERFLKILMTFTPTTVYKGTNVLRKLESFNNQEYFKIKGQLNATVNLGKTDIITFQRKCFGNLLVNKQNQTMNENFLIEMQMRKIVPGKLIVFAKQDKHNRLTIKTNGIFPWTTDIENFLWNNLGWSDWTQWSFCSAECSNGIQQRYRKCLTNHHESVVDQMKSTQNLCNGYNVEQRQCNQFECRDSVNILPMINNISMTKEINTNINQIIDQNEFTIMFTIKIKKQIQKHSIPTLNNNLLVFSSDDIDKTPFTLSFSLVDKGFKVVQVKNSTSDFFIIELNLFDLHWHQIAVSFRRDGLITCFYDCNWDSSKILSKHSFQLPPNLNFEFNKKLSDVVEWKQLSLVSGTRENSQCSSDRTPIFDNNKYLERIFNDEMF